MHAFVHEVVNPGQRRGIVFLHGFLGDDEEFRHVGQEFEQTHTVVYAQLPGHGKHRIERQISFHEVAASLVCFLQTQSPRYWHVVGYSQGGRLALYISVMWPKLVACMTLISASPGLETRGDKLLRIKADHLLVQKLRQVSMKAFLSFWYRLPLFKSFREHPRFLENSKRRLRNDPLQIALALEFMGLGQQPSLWEALSSLRMPVLLIVGAKDSKFCEIAHLMTLRSPKIKRSVVAESGHVVHWEAANELKSRLIDVENRMEKFSAI